MKRGKWEQAEDIPERGNVAMIDGAHFRELERDWQTLNPVVLALIRWVRHPEMDEEQVAESLTLDGDQREVFHNLLRTQMRITSGARDTQRRKRYGGFKQSLRQRFPERKCPVYESWTAFGMPSVDTYAERVMNGEWCDGLPDTATLLRELAADEEPQ